MTQFITLDFAGRRLMVPGPLESKVELHRELDNSGIVACRDDSSEIAATEDLTRCGIDAATRGNQSVQVADGIGEIWMIEEVENISAKFEDLRFRHGEQLGERKVQINLPWPPQTVSADIADICTDGAGHCCSARTRNGLPRLHDRPSEDGWIEKITVGHVLSCVLASHPGYKAGTSQWVRALVQSVE